MVPTNTQFLTSTQSALVTKYLPSKGDGNTKATQAITALWKLIHRWDNDGDIYDNHYSLRAGLNDVSGSANWLYNHIQETRPILDNIKYISSDTQYSMLLGMLANCVLNEDLLTRLDKLPKSRNAYNESGPYSIEEEDEDHYDTSGGASWEDDFPEDGWGNNSHCEIESIGY